MRNDKNLCHKLILPCCRSYPAARQIFNRSIQKFPTSITYCENKEDVIDALCNAVAQGQTVRIRSGGHNYEGYCIGNHVSVIDTSPIKEIKLSENSNIIKVGSGINNRELYGFLSQYQYPFPSGTCPTVSATGLTQGGGWGHSARMFGLTCDNLVEAELINAKGKLLIANESSHSDLFWALRGGGGGNFGVITSFTYRLPPKITQVTYVDIEYSQIDEATAFHFFQTWQEWIHHKENRFTPNSRIFNSKEDGLGIFLRGFFYGTPADAAASIQPFLNISGVKVSLRSVTFQEAVELDASVYPEYERFRFAGRFAYGYFSNNQMKSILSMIRNRAKGAVTCSIALYAMGGKVRDISRCDTAFFYRNADFIIGVETVWEDPSDEPENDSWIDPRFQSLRSLTRGSYINFPYLCTENYMDAYYGKNAARLIDVKMKYDPDHIFRFPQSIRP